MPFIGIINKKAWIYPGLFFSADGELIFQSCFVKRSSLLADALSGIVKVLALYHCLSDLDRVQGSALQQVVSDNPERQTIVDC